MSLKTHQPVTSTACGSFVALSTVLQLCGLRHWIAELHAAGQDEPAAQRPYCGASLPVATCRKSLKKLGSGLSLPRDPKGCLLRPNMSIAKHAQSTAAMHARKHDCGELDWQRWSRWSGIGMLNACPICVFESVWAGRHRPRTQHGRGARLVEYVMGRPLRTHERPAVRQAAKTLLAALLPSSLPRSAIFRQCREAGRCERSKKFRVTKPVRQAQCRQSRMQRRRKQSGLGEQRCADVSFI